MDSQNHTALDVARSVLDEIRGDQGALSADRWANDIQKCEDVVWLLSSAAKIPQTPAPAPAPQPAVQNIECSICFEPLFSHPTVATQCGHMFHDKCMKGWLQKNKICPKCRREAKEELLIPLYP